MSDQMKQNPPPAEDVPLVPHRTKLEQRGDELKERARQEAEEPTEGRDVPPAGRRSPNSPWLGGG